MIHSTRLFLLMLAVAFAPLLSATSAMPALRAEQAWIRMMPGDLPSAAYLVIHNDTDTPRSLTAVTSDVFGQVMLHQSTRSNGMQHMHMVDQVLIPAHTKVSFQPGGYHLMLMQKKRPLKVGQQVVMVLHFADGSSLSTAFAVRATNASE